MRNLTILTAVFSPAVALCTIQDAAAAAGKAEVIAPRSHPVTGKVRVYVDRSARTTRASFRIDGRVVDTDKHKPFRYGKRGLLNTRLLRNGRHRVTVRLRDARRTRTFHRTLQVRNRRAVSAARDTSAPTLAWRAPAEGATVSGVLRGTGCEVVAWDNRSVKRVSFFVDGTRVSQTPYAPYLCNIDTRQLSDGEHTLRAVAVDAARNHTQQTRRIVVRNGAPAPTPTPTPSPTPTPPPGDGSSSGQNPLGPSGTFTRVFTEEFDGTAVNTTRWNTNWHGGCGPINGNETAGYDPSHLTVSNGTLKMLLTDEDTCGRANRGAILTTLNKFTFGPNTAVQFRFKAPGNSTDLYNWPALWSNGTGAWPTTGEFDIAEILGGDLCFKMHQGTAPDSDNQQSSGYCENGGVFANQWTTVTLHRDGNVLKVYRNGVLKATHSSNVTSAQHYLIIDQTSGQWGGPTVTPATLEVDHARVWREG